MSYTCPQCGMTSHNPHDEEHQYCGNCHDFTGNLHRDTFLPGALATNKHLPRDREGNPIDRPLVDDLANVLFHMVVGWKSVIGVDLMEHHEVQRVAARYREFKGREDAAI